VWVEFGNQGVVKVFNLIVRFLVRSTLVVVEV
jgi:hypothetical protein